MPGTLARVVFQLSTGLLEDRVMNDFAFNGDATSAGVRDTIEANLVDFYNTDDSATNSIADRLAAEINRGATDSLIEFYDISTHLDGSSIGSPIETRTWDLGPSASATTMPHEVACCLSFRATYAGVNEITPLPPTGPEGDIHGRARRRGRVFLGPWNEGVMASRPSANLINTITEAAFRLDDTSGPGGSGNWCVWSRADAQLNPVETAWVDNAWDTQRRRGLEATTRTVAF